MKRAATNTARRALCSLLGALALAGCGGQMSEQSCRTTNWYTRGIDDGTRGQPNAALEEYTKECSEHRVNPDRNAWFWGHAKGLVTYCADGPGYDIGKYGVDYQNACAGRPGEVAFLLGHLRGLSERLQSTSADLADLRQRLSGMVASVDAEGMMQRGLILQAEFNRVQSLLNWTEARLQTLAGIPH
jgi:hypothetical protein